MKTLTPACRPVTRGSGPKQPIGEISVLRMPPRDPTFASRGIFRTVIDA